MTGNGENRRQRLTAWRWRLRIAALVVFIMGVLTACAVYGLSTPPVESDDPATIANEKADSSQFSQMYGNAGLLEKQWLDHLKYPGTRAALIVATTVTASGALLFAAGMLNRRH